MNTDSIKAAAAAIANARAGRRGAPAIVNVLDILPPHLLREVMEDAEAALKAAGFGFDEFRLDHLEMGIKTCPHTELTYDDDPDTEDGDAEKPWIMETAGCEVIRFRGATLRELIDQSISFQASGEDFEVWQESSGKAMKARCPDCGERVKTIFDHVDGCQQDEARGEL